MPDTSPRPENSGGFSQEDWDDVSDNPELTDAELAELRPARDVADIFALLPKRERGRPKLADAKVNLTLRVDPVMLDAYKATGPGWQTRMHEALKTGMPPRNGKPGGSGPAESGSVRPAARKAR